MHHETTSGALSARAADLGARRYEASGPQSDADRVLQLETLNADFKAQVAAINRSQAVIEFSLDGIVQTANENFLDVLGYSLGEIRGKHHRMFVEDAYARSPEYRQLWTKLGRGEYVADQFKRIGKSGKEVWIQASYNPILDPDGRPYKVIKLATEITEQVELRTRMEEMLEGLTRNAKALGTSSGDLSTLGETMMKTAEETAMQAASASAASEQVSRNVQTLAAGTEEMSASIREIARNAADAARVASSAVAVATSTNAMVVKLGESSAQIGKVIKVITSIAQQTNLLALNATIEAARAGQAGKGFAVVANEVKELAKETAKATDDITNKISAIQADTSDVVAAISQIGAIIAKVNDIQTTIASAVEEQTATTNEMSRNVSAAARGASAIVDNVSSVAVTARDTSAGAARSLEASRELSRMAAELDRLVNEA